MAKPFRPTILTALNSNSGMLTPDLLMKPGFAEALTGDNVWRLLERVEAVSKGAIEEGEVPPFILVPHRGRKGYGVDFPQVELPPNPDVRKRVPRDPTKPAIEQTNYCPAIVVVNDKIREALEANQKREEASKDALFTVRQLLDGNPYSMTIQSARPGSTDGVYVGTFTLDTRSEADKAKQPISTTHVDSAPTVTQ